MNSKFKGKTACDSCGSSDANAIYERADGSVYYKCFSCGSYKGNGVGEAAVKELNIDLKFWQNASYSSIKDRGISQDTCRFYGVTQDNNKHHYPYYNKTGDVVAVKTRIIDEKEFPWSGKPKEAVLFGQTKFPKGSAQYITICEGELDALAAFQMLGSKWPVVSVKDGAQSAKAVCQKNYEYLDSFDHIIISFDNDEPGSKAAQEVADLFLGKAKIVRNRSDLKDACDYLKNSLSKEYVQDWWKAEKYVPDGIVQGADLWESVNTPVEKSTLSYPLAALNDLTYGIRKGEIVAITAGTGLGKSQFLRELVWHILQNSNDNLGLMFLEESTAKTARSLMSLAANKPLHLPGTEVSEQEIKKAFDETLGTNRIFLFDHFGSLGVDNIISRIRYMAKGCGCSYVWLDHISLLVSDGRNADERKALDEIMTKLATLVQELKICLFIVSHLKRPEGKGHEEGKQVSLSELRGSGGIGQLTDIVIGLERNGQAEDAQERNTTYVRVLKNRFAGLTGPAGAMLYDRLTGRMQEVTDVDIL